VFEADWLGESKGELFARVEGAESVVTFLLIAGFCERAVVVAMIIEL
jgi:hypothetical protein